MSASFLKRGGAWVIAQTVLMIAVLTLGIVFHGQWESRGSILMGTVLLILGSILGIAGVWALGTNRTPLPQPRESSTLVQHGIYAHLRHPLYTSVMLLSLGWSLVWQSWPSLGSALILIPFFYAKAIREEQSLRKKFPDYANYQRRVPRFIPRFHCSRTAKH